MKSPPVSLDVLLQKLSQSTFSLRTSDALGDDIVRIRQLRALLALLSLYVAALLVVIVLSDGADIGCILAGIGGHVLYASAKTALAWREAAWFEAARSRVLQRRLA